MSGRKRTSSSRTTSKGKVPARSQRTLFELGVKKPSLSQSSAVEDEETSAAASPAGSSADDTSGLLRLAEEVTLDSERGDISSAQSMVAAPPPPKTAPSTPKKLHPMFTRRAALMAKPSTPSLQDALPSEANGSPSRPSSPIQILSSPPPSPTSQASGSKHMPITIGSSPSRPISVPGSRIATAPNLAHPFFVPRRATLSGREGTPTPLRHITATQLSAPFPKDQHIQGEQSAFHVPPPPHIVRRRPGRMAVEAVPSSVKQSITGLPPLETHQSSGSQATSFFGCPSTITDADRDRLASSIPLSHTLHPAINRALKVAASRDNAEHSNFKPQQQLWTDKWAPQRADEVLGNREHAEYLLDWLAALQLTASTLNEPPPVDLTISQSKRKRRLKETGSGKPSVLRAVVKRRGRKRQRLDSDDEDDWIANDDDEIEDAPTEWLTSDDELLLKGPPSPSVTSENGEPPPSEPDPPLEPPHPSRTRRTFAPLTNTILLTGPPGCGKTAAVYACAAELGYRVFEVYPGIGKRSGASLESLVGDVGKNHTVQVGELSPRKRRPNAARPLLQALTGQEPVMGMDDSPLSPNVDATLHVSQSLILLEEVDILFKEDVNFWPTVVDIIRDCKRPVIMTCNDHTLVPLSDLPLQDILGFSPCPTDLATSYLQCLASAEGYLVNRDTLGSFAKASYSLTSADLPDTPQHPLSGQLPEPDLRASILNLQLLCTHASPSTDSVWDSRNDQPTPPRHLFEWSGTEGAGVAVEDTSHHQLRHLHQLTEHCDNASFADSFLTRSAQDATESVAPNTSGSSATDNESGHTMLPKESTASGFQSVLPAYYEHDHALVDELARLSVLTFEKPRMPEASRHATEALDAAAAFSTRSAFQRQVVAALGELLSISAPLMPRAEVFLDYEAWIRYMVSIDDMLEIKTAEVGTGVLTRHGRQTRNSQQRYVRYLSLGNDLRKALAGTSLRMDWVEE